MNAPTFTEFHLGRPGIFYSPLPHIQLRLLRSALTGINVAEIN